MSTTTRSGIPVLSSHPKLLQPRSAIAQRQDDDSPEDSSDEEYTSRRKQVRPKESLQDLLNTEPPIGWSVAPAREVSLKSSAASTRGRKGSFMSSLRRITSTATDLQNESIGELEEISATGPNKLSKLRGIRSSKSTSNLSQPPRRPPIPEYNFPLQPVPLVSILRTREPRVSGDQSTRDLVDFLNADPATVEITPPRQVAHSLPASSIRRASITESTTEETSGSPKFKAWLVKKRALDEMETIESSPLTASASSTSISAQSSTRTYDGVDWLRSDNMMNPLETRSFASGFEDHDRSRDVSESVESEGLYSAGTRSPSASSIPLARKMSRKAVPPICPIAVPAAIAHRPLSSLILSPSVLAMILADNVDPSGLTHKLEQLKTTGTQTVANPVVQNLQSEPPPFKILDRAARGSDSSDESTTPGKTHPPLSPISSIPHSPSGRELHYHRPSSSAEHYGLTRGQSMRSTSSYEPLLDRPSSNPPSPRRIGTPTTLSVDISTQPASPVSPTSIVNTMTTRPTYPDYIIPQHIAPSPSSDSLIDPSIPRATILRRPLPSTPTPQRPLPTPPISPSRDPIVYALKALQESMMKGANIPIEGGAIGEGVLGGGELGSVLRALKESMSGAVVLLEEVLRRMEGEGEKEREKVGGARVGLDQVPEGSEDDEDAFPLLVRHVSQ